jgi:hypothetical protein
MGKRYESCHLGTTEMAGLKDKSGPPGNMNAFKHGLAANGEEVFSCFE